MKIGIFDSGFGGLNIMKSIVQTMPQYDYVYLGDTARTPYGTRSQETILEYTKEAVDFLFKQDCSLIILACNTASAEALSKIQKECLPQTYSDKNVLGVIIPACEKAVEISKNKNIGIIATSSSVQSETFLREIKKLDTNTNIFQNACPLLVPIVEAGENDIEIINKVLSNYLNPLIDQNIDTLILGCTHYGLLEKEIKDILDKSGKKIMIVSEGPVVAEKLKDYLSKHAEFSNKLSKNSSRLFFTTDLTDSFEKLGGLFFGEKIKVDKIHL